MDLHTCIHLRRDMYKLMWNDHHFSRTGEPRKTRGGKQPCSILELGKSPPGCCFSSSPPPTQHALSMKRYWHHAGQKELEIKPGLPCQSSKPGLSFTYSWGEGPISLMKGGKQRLQELPSGSQLA